MVCLKNILSCLPVDRVTGHRTVLGDDIVDYRKKCSMLFKLEMGAL